MLSNFHTWSDNDKKMLVAKILHEINYSQASLELMESIIKLWEQYPSRPVTFFNQTNTIHHGTTNN